MTVNTVILDQAREIVELKKLLHEYEKVVAGYDTLVNLKNEEIADLPRIGNELADLVKQLQKRKW
jgi:hypothetical protein